jgi:protein phosphatase
MGPESINWDAALQHVALSDIGMRRGNNQDSWKISLARDAAAWRERGHVFVVADGMGAHAAGELASKLAVDNIPLIYDKLRQLPAHLAIGEAVRQANSLIHARGEGSAEFHGMGTTCSALVLLPGAAVVAHVGDSRIYRLRRGTLHQLTFDHSLVWELMEAGRVREEQMPGFIPKNVITRSLGPQAAVEVDIEGIFPVEAGDVFLLCTDGLTGLINDSQIACLLSQLPPEDAAQTLVDLANLRGGPDNITVVIARVAGPPIAAADSTNREADRAAAGPKALVWIAAACLLVAALVTAGAGWWPASVVAVVAAGLLVGWKVVRGAAPESARPDQPLGRAPYRSVVAFPDAHFAAELSDLARQLCQVAEEERWDITQDDLEERLHEASEAAGRNDFGDAIVGYTNVVRMVMRRIRARQSQRAGDSSIDL